MCKSGQNADIHLLNSKKRKELKTVSPSLCLMTLFQIAKIRISYIIVYEILLKIKIIQIITFPY